MWNGRFAVFTLGTEGEEALETAAQAKACGDLLKQAAARLNSVCKEVDVV